MPRQHETFSHGTPRQRCEITERTKRPPKIEQAGKGRMKVW